MGSVDFEDCPGMHELRKAAGSTKGKTERTQGHSYLTNSATCSVWASGWGLPVLSFRHLHPQVQWPYAPPISQLGTVLAWSQPMAENLCPDMTCHGPCSAAVAL